MRRCLICGLPKHPPEKARGGYLPHRYDPGERRVEDRGREARRDVGPYQPRIVARRNSDT